MRSRTAIALIVCGLFTARGYVLAAPELQPGPLSTKAILQWVTPLNSDPESFVQRAYLRLDNPTSDAAEFEKIDGVFLSSSGEELFLDQPPTTQPLPAGQGRDVYFRFTNPGLKYDLGLRVTVRYKMAGKIYERRFQLTKQQPSFPEGYQPK